MTTPFRMLSRHLQRAYARVSFPALLSLALGLSAYGTAWGTCTVAPTDTIISEGQTVALTATCTTAMTTVNWKRGGVSQTGILTISQGAVSPIGFTASGMTGSPTYTTYPFTIEGTDAIGAVPASPAVNVYVGSGPTLTVTPTAGGTVSGSSGISACTSAGGTCSASYSYGTLVNLTATADAGQSFTAWGGSCSGSGACSVSMNGSRAVTATFAGSSVTPDDAPTITGVAGGNAQIIVNVTRGATHGATLLSYTAYCGTTWAVSSSNSITVNGLVNGTPYTCTVKATTSAGDSAFSAPSGSVTPGGATLPAAPVVNSATAGNANIAVAFTPGALGSGTLLYYTVNCGGVTQNGGASPITVSGLSNGTAYACMVETTSTVGTGPWSAAASPVTPTATPSGSAPSAPTIGSGTAGNASAAIGFSAVSGAHLYIATCNPGAHTGSGVASPVTVSGLSNNTAYTCSVQAQNAYGTSAASGTVGVTPGVPSVPTIGTATAGNASASVAFTASASGGGGTIDTYRATCSPGNITASAAASPINVTGLSNGTPYTCTVAAHNTLGFYSAESAASNSVTPAACTPPSAPTIGTVAAASATSISVGFTPGAQGSGTLVNYSATCGSSTVTGGASPITVTGLTQGSTYTCTVTTTTTCSTSAASAASASVALVVPNAPTIGTATAGNASASVAFTTGGVPANAPAITGYRATCSPGSITGTSASSPITVSGLTNGTAYTCTVAAQNAVGYSTESAASAPPVTPSSGACGGYGSVLGVDGDQDYNMQNLNNWWPPGDSNASLTVTGACGTALRFNTNTAVRRGIVINPSGNGPGSGLNTELFISATPHDYSTPADATDTQVIYCRRVGANLTTMWVTSTTSTGNGDCNLQANQTYYLNVRPYQAANPYHDPTSLEIGGTAAP